MEEIEHLTITTLHAATAITGSLVSHPADPPIRAMTAPESVRRENSGAQHERKPHYGMFTTRAGTDPQRRTAQRDTGEKA